jgi:hypothetical protein
MGRAGRLAPFSWQRYAQRGSKTEDRDVTGHVGDRIIVESERVAQPGREGVIEEVLKEEPPRYQVRWEDGRTSIFSPSAGAATIEQKSKRAKAK